MGQFVSSSPIVVSLSSPSAIGISFLLGFHFFPEGLEIQGTLSPSDSPLHISVLVMRAEVLALLECQEILLNQCIMVSSDNSTVVSYLRRQGETHVPSLSLEVWNLYQWALPLNISF